MIINKIISKYKRFGLTGLFESLVYLMIYNYYRILRKRFLVRKIHKFKLELDLKDKGISRQLVVNGTREEQLKYLLDLELKEGMTVLDIGANIGYYPMIEAAIVGKKGKVYAIEPDKTNYERLIKNVGLNLWEDRILTFNFGVSNKCGLEKFYLSDHSNLHTFLKNGFDGIYTTPGTNGNYVECEVKDLNSFLADKNKIDLIRMDVEGYEVEILEGLEPAIRNNVFTGDIVFECHFPKYHEEDHSISCQLNMLRENGYFVKYMTSNDESKSKIITFGYTPFVIITTGQNIQQGIYRGIDWNDAIKIISTIGGVRDVYLTKKK